MKKLFSLLSVGLLVCGTLSAKTIVIDLAAYSLSGLSAETPAPVLTDGELTVTYDLAAWGAGGVVYALDNLKAVDSISFEYIGDANMDKWVSFQVYLEDAVGTKFINSAADLNISQWTAAWTEKAYLPQDELWTTTGVKLGDHPVVAFGFWANPGEAVKGTFAIRNVKVYTKDDATAIQSVESASHSTKIIENGQVYILRDGARYTLLGTRE